LIGWRMISPMPSDSITHFVFVDFENVTEIDLGAVKGKPVHVTLLIGKKQTWLDLTLVRQIHQLHAQVDLVEVGASGHNALDLTLTYYLGRTVQRAPGAHYHIVSKDKDFEPMIGHARGEGIKVARYDSFAALPFLAPAKKPAAPPKHAVPAKAAPAARKPTVDHRARVLARLKNHASRNRPADELALRHYLETGLGKSATETTVNDFVRELRETGIVAIDPKGKVSYPAAP
jgi:hypothetical protein